MNLTAVLLAPVFCSHCFSFPLFCSCALILYLFFPYLYFNCLSCRSASFFLVFFCEPKRTRELTWFAVVRKATNSNLPHLHADLPNVRAFRCWPGLCFVVRHTLAFFLSHFVLQTEQPNSYPFCSPSSDCPFQNIIFVSFRFVSSCFVCLLWRSLVPRFLGCKVSLAFVSRLRTKWRRLRHCYCLKRARKRQLLVTRA